MAIRSALARIPRLSPAAARSSRCFSDGKGRILSEEERAKETVYIQKMERERQEKLKKHAEKEKAESQKKPEESHKG